MLKHTNPSVSFEQKVQYFFCLFGFPLKTTGFRLFPMSYVQSKKNNPVWYSFGVIMDPNRLFRCGTIRNISGSLVF